MDGEKDEVIGIVGGMGPQAGLALYNSILCHTKAETEQQHLSVILMSFPGCIVDRTLFLEGIETLNPAFVILDIINKLEKAGAKVVGIACNTAHAPRIYNVILEELAKSNSTVNLLNMPLETCKYIKNEHSHVVRVGLMTTNGTYKSEIYKNILQGWGYDVIIPDFKFQDEIIHKMIYDPEFGIKSNTNGITGEARLLMNKALLFFKQEQAHAIILGCTELSLILSEKVVDDMIIVDSTQALAKALIREATNHGSRKRVLN